MNDVPHLRPVSMQVEQRLNGEHPEVMRLISESEQQWKALHDRLISIISACLDEAVERGVNLEAFLGGVHRRSSVGVERLVSTRPTPESVASLLRSHHSVGEVRVGEGTVIFEHDCGSGLVHWRNNPDVAKVREGEVAGVAAGVPRYCARCIHTITAVGQGSWRVTPPRSTAERCTWEVDVQPPRDR